MKTIPLYWWKPPPLLKRIVTPRYWNVSSNFGDELSYFLVSHILSNNIARAKKEDSNKLLALGSIFHFARKGDVIWGTGINGKKLDFKVPNVKVLSVRGPKTRKILLEQGINCPEIYGDPGILTSRYMNLVKSNRYKYSIVPHFSELKHPEIIKYKDAVIDPTDSLENVIKRITRSELVISSSLHGIIVAESYGIPAVLLRITENEPIFKYQDYYLGTGRILTNISSSVTAALNSIPHDLPNIDSVTIDKELIKWSESQ